MTPGNRMTNGQTMPRTRWHTNALMSTLVSFLARQTIPDTQCGYRLIRKEVLESIRLRSKRYEIETEILLKAAMRRWKIVSVPIKTIYRDDHQSYIRPSRDTLRFIGIVFRNLVRRFIIRK